MQFCSNTPVAFLLTCLFIKWEFFLPHPTVADFNLSIWIQSNVSIFLRVLHVMFMQYPYNGQSPGRTRREREMLEQMQVSWRRGSDWGNAHGCREFSGTQASWKSGWRVNSACWKARKNKQIKCQGMGWNYLNYHVVKYPAPWKAHRHIALCALKCSLYLTSFHTLAILFLTVMMSLSLLPRWLILFWRDNKWFLFSFLPKQKCTIFLSFA